MPVAVVGGSRVHHGPGSIHLHAGLSPPDQDQDPTVETSTYARGGGGGGTHHERSSQS